MEAPRLTCVLYVGTEIKGWQKTLTKIFQDIQGLTFSIDVKNAYMFLQGQVDPVIFIKKLYKARGYAMLYRIDYGYEENPQGTRKPNSHFTRCVFELNVLDKTWFKKMIRALTTIQGVSFTVDSPTNMGYLRGNIETGVLMKMLVKTGIDISTIDYGVEDKDPSLNPPPPKKPEAPAIGTATQSTKDTEPTPQVASTSTEHQVTVHKRHGPCGFRSFCCF